MKKNIKQILILTTICIMGFSSLLKAQATYKLAGGPDVSIKVLGSSNVHDWVMTSTAMESQGSFKFSEVNQLRAITSFSFSLNATSLKSEHESMDNRTYKTIKADKYPKITYKLSTAAITLVQKNKYQVKTTGDLTIAGTTQTITMNVTAVVNADNTLSCTGAQNIKLTDYKISPPSFMLGAMKVKDDLTIQFNLTYKGNQLLTKTN